MSGADVRSLVSASGAYLIHHQQAAVVPDQGLGFLQVASRELDCPTHSLPEEDQRQTRRQQGSRGKGGVSRGAEAKAASAGEQRQRRRQQGSRGRCGVSGEPTESAWAGKQGRGSHSRQ